MKHYSKRQNCRLAAVHLTAGLIIVVGGAAQPAKAVQISNTGDWDITWNNTIAYDLGTRVQGIDQKIGNNPNYENSEYKFAKAGDIVTNRLDLLTELTANHQDEYGFRLTASGWKDFAYDNHNVATNHSLPKSESSVANGQYSGYIDKYFNQGGEIGDAFVFKNFEAGHTPIQLKFGRYTEYWGNALFSSFQSISYGQSPIDIVKAVTTPGAETKELFLPRGQAGIHAQVSDTLSLAANYAFEWRPNRLTEGGTYLDTGADWMFKSPNDTYEGVFNRGPDKTPNNLNSNIGLSAKWSPAALGDGTVGFYARRFAETMPYTPEMLIAGTNTFHESYDDNVKLYGISFDKEIAGIGAGFEANFRQNTALYSQVLGTDNGTGGARGDAINIIANGIYGLTPTKLYNTGSIVGEVAYTRVTAVTANKSLYFGEGYLPCTSTQQNYKEGCATKDNVDLHLLVDPQWLQVFPGIDIDTPLAANYGLFGNGQFMGTSGDATVQGSVTYSIGVNANIQNKYTATLSYNGYYAPVHTGTNGLDTGSGSYMMNDKGWLSLVLKTSF
jgi:hypothetical protein